MNPTGLDVQWSAKDYGLIDTMMLCAVNADQVDLDWLAVQTGVYALPLNLDSNPSPQEISELETSLEISYIPANWITPADTWRDALRTIGGMFMFMQRFTAIIGGPPSNLASMLNTQLNDLDPQSQEAILETYSGRGYNSSGVVGNVTMRVILKDFADQWGHTPIHFGFTTL